MSEKEVLDELDLIAIAFCTDSDFFYDLVINQGRIEDVMAIIGVMIGKNEAGIQDA